MIHYRNKGGNSGVRLFEILDSSILVRFSDGKTYLYTYQSAGSSHIENMKNLAIKGVGLNSYINRKVRKNYERKY